MHFDLLQTAEVHYKLALGVSSTVASSDGLSLSYLQEFTFDKHRLEGHELSLNKEQERFAAQALEHCATYLMAVQMDKALQDLVPNRFQHADEEILSASCIVRLIRNAFAHNPFAPKWQIYNEHKDRIYRVEGIIELDTSTLHGKFMRRGDYGGPLALLSLLKFVQRLIPAQLAAQCTHA
jgi:hypothetical protein